MDDFALRGNFYLLGHDSGFSIQSEMLRYPALIKKDPPKNVKIPAIIPEKKKRMSLFFIRIFFKVKFFFIPSQIDIDESFVKNIVIASVKPY